MKRILITFIFIFFMPMYAMGEQLYVQSMKAPVKESPDFSSPAVWTAHRGDKLNSDTKKGIWYHVESEGKTGWIAKMLVKKNPPMKKVSSVLAKTDVKLKNEARRRPSAYTTAAAARGLSEDRARTGKTRYKADYEALNTMESLEIDEQTLSGFVDDGGLK